LLNLSDLTRRLMRNNLRLRRVLHFFKNQLWDCYGARTMSPGPAHVEQLKLMEKMSLERSSARRGERNEQKMSITSRWEADNDVEPDG
jgi:hypothetical protein